MSTVAVGGVAVPAALQLGFELLYTNVALGHGGEHSGLVFADVVAAHSEDVQDGLRLLSTVVSNRQHKKAAAALPRATRLSLQRMLHAFALYTKVAEFKRRPELLAVDSTERKLTFEGLNASDVSGARDAGRRAAEFLGLAVGVAGAGGSGLTQEDDELLLGLPAQTLGHSAAVVPLDVVGAASNALMQAVAALLHAAVYDDPALAATLLGPLYVETVRQGHRAAKADAQQRAVSA